MRTVSQKTMMFLMFVLGFILGVLKTESRVDQLLEYAVSVEADLKRCNLQDQYTIYKGE